MDIEREQKIEIGVSIGGLAVVIGAMMAVGASYSADGGLTAQGGQLLIGTIVGFILLMAVTGYLLATKVTADEDNDDETPELA